jgi:hypothetical protein
MRFRNITDDARDVPSLGVCVEAGGLTPELDKEQAAGFTGQTEVWASEKPATKEKD